MSIKLVVEFSNQHTIYIIIVCVNRAQITANCFIVICVSKTSYFVPSNDFNYSKYTALIPLIETLINDQSLHISRAKRTKVYILHLLCV